MEIVCVQLQTEQMCCCSVCVRPASAQTHNMQRKRGKVLFKQLLLVMKGIKTFTNVVSRLWFNIQTFGWNVVILFIFLRICSAARVLFFTDFFKFGSRFVPSSSLSLSFLSLQGVLQMFLGEECITTGGDMLTGLLHWCLFLSDLLENSSAVKNRVNIKQIKSYSRDGNVDFLYFLNFYQQITNLKVEISDPPINKGWRRTELSDV